MNFGIGTLAKGLLGVLRSARSGVGLRECSDVIVPTFDVTQNLGCDFRKLAAETALSPLVNGSNALPNFGQVPVGRCWRILAGSVAVSTAAGSQINQAVLEVRPPEGNGPLAMFLTGAIRPLLLATADGTTSLVSYPGLILTAGTTFFLTCTGIVVGAGCSGNVRLYVEEFQA